MSTHQTGIPFFDQLDSISAGISPRPFGGMSLNRDRPEIVVGRREIFFSTLGIDLKQTVWADLVHGTRVETVTELDWGRGAFEKESAIPACDGLWTETLGVYLCTTHADCLPLYCYCKGVRPAVGMAHCGWRSIADGLPRQMLIHTVSQFNAAVSDLHFGIGPGIRLECFEIGEDTVERFSRDVVYERQGHWFVDLAKAIRLDLMQSGLDENQISDSGLCSKCTPLYSSYRRDREAVAPMVAFIGLIK